jgi:putative transposase
MEVSEARRLKQLEDENRRLNQIVASQALDNEALKAVLSRKWRSRWIGAPWSTS